MLFVFDIDGTIVSHNKGCSYIPKATIKAMKMIQTAGHKIVIATGRNYSQTKEVMDELNILDAIVCDGAALFINNKLVYKKSIEANAMKSYIKDSTKNNLAIIAQGVYNNYISGDFSKSEANEVVNSYYRGINNSETILHSLKECDEYTSFTCFNSFNFQDFNAVSVIKWETGTAIKPQHTSKASGIKEYISINMIKHSDVYVFGDSFNDIEMFQEFYDNSYILGDAHEMSKKHAKYILDNIDNNGLYKGVISILNK